MTFAVWAPRAERVTLVTQGSEHPMAARDDGWFTSELDAVGDYGYRLDDDDTVLPDPRSRRQPYGVHGMSRAYEIQPFAPFSAPPLANAIIYELHIGTFTPDGTLDAAVERLDHLVALGVNYVELLPVNDFNGDYNWGYDGVLWFAVHETYGGPAAYQRFVEACHSRGLAVIQDVVYNHLGPSGNYLPHFGPYLAEGSANTWGDTINLDGDESPAVREYIIDNALLWLRDYGVDGLRLDAVHALVDEGEIHLLRELSDRVDELADASGRTLSLIAESDLNDPRLITAQDHDGYGLTAQWSDDYHHAAHVALTGETAGYYEDFASLAALAKTMTGGFFHDGTYSSFRGRNHGAPIPTDLVEPWRLVTFVQDHDQIGNRAAGDRLAATLTPGELELAAALVLLGPSTPMLFMGEEWGASTPWQFFTSHPEPELGAAVSGGRLKEFERMGWDPADVPDPQDPATFARSHLDWSELDDDGHHRLFEVYRGLIALRKSLPVVSSFRFVNCEFDEADRWLRMDRPGASVYFNFALEERTIPGLVGLHTVPPRSFLVVAGESIKSL